MASYVKDIDLGLKAFIEELQNAKNSSVTIGVHEGERSVDGLNIAEYATFNEYGTSKIPERSFMRTTFDENVENLQGQMAIQFGRVADGKITVYKALSAIGLMHQTQVKDKINSNIQPKNSNYTIAKKKSSRTLIDHGEAGGLLGSIRYVISK